MKFITIIFLFVIITNSVFAQISRETRAVFVATNYQLDWPPPNTTRIEDLKKTLIEILDKSKMKKINTIFFQVRNLGDVLYKSKYEPAVSFLADNNISLNDFDPLEFAIKEAHKRGLAIHAMLNMIRVKVGESNSVDPKHIMAVEPDWVVKYFDNNNYSYWIDPGVPEARMYLINLVAEIIGKYKVDGVLLDYFRYPGTDFADQPTYKEYGNNAPVEDWRCNNLNELLRNIYLKSKKINPYIKIGVAPIGIYENTEEVKGLEGKNDVYQDSRKWLKEGYVDYLVPQIYWGVSTKPKFEDVAKQWINNKNGKDIILGVGAYNKNFEKEVKSYIAIARRLKANGMAFFRYKNIDNLTAELFDYQAYPDGTFSKIKTQTKLPESCSYELADTLQSKYKIIFQNPDSETKYYSLYNMDKSKSFQSQNFLDIFNADSNNIEYGVNSSERISNKIGIKSADKLWNETPKAFVITLKNNRLIDEASKYGVTGKPKLFFDKESELFILAVASKTQQSIIIAVSLPDNKSDKFAQNILPGLNYISLPYELKKGSKLRLKLGKEEFSLSY